MTKAERQLPPLEQGLLTAMRALDNQIARAMQRSPSEREAHGVQKWEPIATRVENVCAFVLNSLGDEDVTLDSLLVLSQAMAKSLALVVDDLGLEGLGEIRSGYVSSALESIAEDASRTLRGLTGGAEVN